MTTDLQTVIVSAQKLPFFEQVELLRAVSRFLSQSYHKKETPLTAFWQPQSIEEIVQAQQTKPIQDISTLRVDFWAEQETDDAFIEYVYQQRKEDVLAT